jgi:iron donor protein CyaY
MDDISFQRHADEALSSLNRKLATAGDALGFESDLNDGALKIEFDEPPAKFVISPNRPVHQIWVSALTRSFKLDWVEPRQAFAFAPTSQTLDELIAEVVGTQLGEKVVL